MIAISSAVLLSTCTKKSTARKRVDSKQTANHAQHIKRLKTSEDDTAFVSLLLTVRLINSKEIDAF